MGIREEMPVLARHEGVWDGVYTYFDSQDREIDRHKSRLFCRIPGSIIRPITTPGTTAAPMCEIFPPSTATAACGGTTT